MTNYVENGKIIELNRENAEELYHITLAANNGHTTWTPHSFQYELENDHYFYLGFQVEGKLAGYIGCMLIADEISINNFAVLPQYGQHGIGTLLLERTIQAGIEKGAPHFILEVRVSNQRAISLYKKMGFQKISFRRDYYTEPVEDALVLYLHKEEPVYRGGKKK